MDTMRLDGRTFARMLVGGAGNIRENSSEIDDLNVFPVPDGDTGSNMSSTVEKGCDRIDGIDDNASLCEVAHRFASGTVLGARGNSGVILSQIFKGMDLGLSTCESVDAVTLAKAYELGVKQSYAAVAKPVEGTILTVFREAVEKVSPKLGPDSSIEDFLRLHIEQAKETLSHTKEMLPVLAEADVIDSGGAGYVKIAEGMYRALIDPAYVPKKAASNESGTLNKSVDISAFTRDSVLEFGYCTELLIRLQSSKVNVDEFDTSVILDWLKAHGGDSIVCFKEDDVVKIHVHTMDPGSVLTECRRYGEFLTVKVENMALQHEEIILKETRKKKVAVVAMALGDGIADSFKELGADVIVGENPSTGDFINAMESVDARNYILLPNDGNVVMAAMQAAQMKGNVQVVPTKSVAEGFGVLSMLTPDVDDLESMVSDLKEEASNVTTLYVALASRDAEISGQTIREGDYIAMYSKDHVVSDCDDKVKALTDLLSSVEDMDEKEIMTVFFGKDVTEKELDRAVSAVESGWPDIEADFRPGGQDVYSFIVGLE